MRNLTTGQMAALALAGGAAFWFFSKKKEEKALLQAEAAEKAVETAESLQAEAEKAAEQFQEDLPVIQDQVLKALEGAEEAINLQLVDASELGALWNPDPLLAPMAPRMSIVQELRAGQAQMQTKRVGPRLYEITITRPTGEVLTVNAKVNWTPAGPKVTLFKAGPAFQKIVEERRATRRLISERAMEKRKVSLGQARQIVYTYMLSKRLVEPTTTGRTKAKSPSRAYPYAYGGWRFEFDKTENGRRYSLTLIVKEDGRIFPMTAEYGTADAPKWRDVTPKPKPVPVVEEDTIAVHRKEGDKWVTEHVPRAQWEAEKAADEAKSEARTAAIGGPAAEGVSMMFAVLASDLPTWKAQMEAVMKAVATKHGQPFDAVLAEQRKMMAQMREHVEKNIKAMLKDPEFVKALPGGSLSAWVAGKMMPHLAAEQAEEGVPLSSATQAKMANELIELLKQRGELAGDGLGAYGYSAIPNFGYLRS